MSNRRSFINELCALCQRRPSTPRGEHVIPQWLSRWMDKRFKGPFTKVQDGKAIERRDGTVWERDYTIRYQMPCCEPCNSELDTRFESAKPLILRFAEGGTLEAHETMEIGLWWLKTVLLMRHPATASEVGDGPFWKHPFGGDVDLYTWLIDKSMPPDWLTLYTCRPPLGEERLQRNHDGNSVFHWTHPKTLQAYSPDIAIIGVADTNFQLLYHPGSTLDHRCPDARQLWPAIPARLTNHGGVTAESFLLWEDAWDLSMRAILTDNADPFERPFSGAWTRGMLGREGPIQGIVSGASVGG